MATERFRGRRIAPGAAAFAAAVGAIWVAATIGPFDPEPPPPTATSTPNPTGVADLPEPAASEASARVGFVGLPPEGATPSRPRQGELVLRYFGRRFAHWYQVWVYADGRLVWQREGNLREGANELATGFLEQHLSPEGIDLLRRRGSAGDALFGFPWRPPYPASWLPPRAWDDRAIRAFVPTRFAVCYQGVLRSIEPDRILRWLPAPATRLLLRAESFALASVEGWIRGFGGGCSAVTTADARAIADALEEAGIDRDEEFREAYALTYFFRHPGGADREIVIRFEPILPHGEVACTSCGAGRRLRTTSPA